MGDRVVKGKGEKYMVTEDYSSLGGGHTVIMYYRNVHLKPLWSLNQGHSNTLQYNKILPNSHLILLCIGAYSFYFIFSAHMII